MTDDQECLATLKAWSEVFMHHSMHNFIRYTKEAGLSMSQVGALFRVLHKGSISVSDIGDELGVTNAAASQMIERMVQQGLLLRMEDPTDRRVKQIELTEKGRQVLQGGIQARQSWIEELAHRLTAAEQEQVTAALKILVAKARPHHHHAHPHSHP